MNARRGDMTLRLFVLQRFNIVLLLDFTQR